MGRWPKSVHWCALFQPQSFMAVKIIELCREIWRDTALPAAAAKPDCLVGWQRIFWNEKRFKLGLSDRGGCKPLRCAPCFL
jgi:hypothetical protein